MPVTMILWKMRLVKNGFIIFNLEVWLIVLISHVIYLHFLKLLQSVLHETNLQISLIEYQQSIY